MASGQAAPAHESLTNPRFGRTSGLALGLAELVLLVLDAVAIALVAAALVLAAVPVGAAPHEEAATEGVRVAAPVEAAVTL